MKINQLKIKKYRKFEDLSITFGPNINVIIGKNEAGKSTITRAILDAMYLEPKSKAKPVKDTLSWGKEDLGLLEMDIESSKGSFVLIKDLDQGKVSLKGKGLREMVDQDEISEYFKESVGIGSNSMYVNTAFISHKDMANLKNRSDLIEAIRNVAVEGEGNVSVNKLINEFKKKLQILNKGIGRMVGSFGTIMSLRSKIDTLRDELELRQSELDSLIHSKSEFNEVKKGILKMEKERDVLSNMIFINDEIRKGRDMEKKLRDNISDNEKKVERVKEIDEIIEDLNKKVKGYDIKKIEDEIRALEDIERNVSSVDTGRGPVVNILVLISFLIPLVLFFLSNNNIYFFLSVIAGFVSIAYIYLRKGNKGKRRKNIEGEKQKILSKYDLQDKEGLIQLKGKIEEYNHRFSELSAEKNGILFDLDIDKVEAGLKVNYQDLKGLNVNELDPDKLIYELEPKDYLIKKHEMNELNEKLEVQGTKLIKLESMIENIKVSGEDINEIKEKIMYMEEELKYNEESAKVYEMILEGLENSLKETARDFKLNAKDFIEQMLKKITLGRYDKVLIEDDLSIKVYSKEKNDWVVPDIDLSSGTIDEIYFILRLALLELLGKNEKIPIILDDPFVTFDSERLERTREILDGLKDQQILLFTHNTNYMDWGKLIEL